MTDGDTFEALVTDLLECLIGWPTYSAWESRLHLLAATPAGVLDEAWAAAEKALPENWDLWLAATGPGFMAQANGPRDESVQAWSQADPELPNYDPNATPAAALLALAAALGRSGSGGGRG